MEEWLARLPQFAVADYKTLEPQLLQLDAHLTLRSHIVGYSLTEADLAIWGAIRGSKVGMATIKKGAITNLCRWFRYIEETNYWLVAAVQKLTAGAVEKRAAASRKGGSYDIELKDTGKGVVTRFPPEPSYAKL